MVEVFFQSDSDYRNYKEVEVSPLGLISDIFLLDICKPLHYEDRISGELKCVVNVFGTVDGRVG